jgi:glycosyltransferase involved in cell wall biosynthesis
MYRDGADVRLTIAGDVANSKEASYWEQCRELIEKEPASIHIRKEFIPDESLPEVFAACHCLLLPYTTFFSDSGVAFMALSNGRPIVSTRAGGLGPLLDAAELGVTIKEATPDGVKDAIGEVLRLGIPEIERLGRSGAHHVNTECGWPKVARKTKEMYARYALSAEPEIVMAGPQ